MTLNLLVDGDSLARTPSTGRLSPPQLDAALSSLGTIINHEHVRALVVISSSFAEALGIAQCARFDKFGAGSLVLAPSNLDYRDFLVRSANDGSAIIVSNSAFTRQRDFFPWLAEHGSGRHVLARHESPISQWTFIEARPLGPNRRSLAELLAGAPTPPSTFAPPEPPLVGSAHQGEGKDLTEKTRARQALDDWLSERRHGEENEVSIEELLSRNEEEKETEDSALDSVQPQSSQPTLPGRRRSAPKRRRASQANKQGSKEK